MQHNQVGKHATQAGFAGELLHTKSPTSEETERRKFRSPCTARLLPHLCRKHCATTAVFWENHCDLGKDLSEEILNSNTLSLTESQINKIEFYKRTELFAYLLKKALFSQQIHQQRLKIPCLVFIHWKHHRRNIKIQTTHSNRKLPLDEIA